MIVFDSDHLLHEHERPDMERNIRIVTRPDEKTQCTHIITLIIKVCGGTNIHSKQAH